MKQEQITATYFQSHPMYEGLTLQDCVLQYQTTPTDFLLGAILYKLKGTLNYYLFKKTNHPDKHEILALFEEKLMECLTSYNSTSSKFITYYSTCISNSLKNFIKANPQNLLSLDYDYDSDKYNTIDNMVDLIVTKDFDMCNSESLILLGQLKDKLDDNAYKVCKVILRENHKLTQTEIATEIGLTLPAIKNIFIRLQKTFQAQGLNF